jgi:polyisoprenoid-binding protein YceI
VRTKSRPIYVAFIAGLSVLACSGGEPQTAFAGSDQAAIAARAEPASGEALRFVLAPTGNAVRYRVRERLVGRELPNDAVGETRNITGAIAIDSSGKVMREASKFVVNAGTFVSDNNRRDGYVRARLLETDVHPEIVLVPTEVRGVSLPLPTSGTRPIEVTGDLIVRGVTRPTTWRGTARFQDGRLTGSAATAFTFNDVQMEQPRVRVLLSVADTIRLEMDFNLIRQR